MTAGSSEASNSFSIPYLLLRDGLYNPRPLTPALGRSLIALENYREPLDAYCPHCGRQSLFTRTGPVPEFPPAPEGAADAEHDLAATQALRDRSFSLEFACGRCSQALVVYFRVQQMHLIKTGQYPSVYDLHPPDRDFAEILDARRRRELARAELLHAHGVGIGAFVYLRGVFESLLEETHQELTSDPGWNEEHYRRADVPGKVNLVGDRLPAFVVEHRHLWAIVDKSPQQLTEKECQDYFPAVNQAVRLILTRKANEQRERRATEAARQAVADLTQRIS
ncbi:MAG: hypothetical protein GX774_06205 [Armatimonadetes bacterium]|nr:hypothetical protein [Armatimonadota bacterium]